MVDILKRDESIPLTYPPVPSGLSAAAMALDSDMIWARIEDYTAWRWTARAVMWTIQGPGAWVPDLTPVTVSTTEVWEDDAWAPETLTDGPLGGYVLDGDGPYRITANVGGGTVPVQVDEAFRRLAEYTADTTKTPAGSSAYTVNVGPIDIATTRNPAWLARAIINSGAGDLLRNYRRT